MNFGVCVWDREEPRRDRRGRKRRRITCKSRRIALRDEEIHHAALPRHLAFRWKSMGVVVSLSTALVGPLDLERHSAECGCRLDW